VDGSGVTQPVSGTVTIQDGGNVITVDGTVAVTNAGLTELAAAINASSQMDVNIAAGSVTANAGTNLNTSALLTTAAHDAAFGTAGTADAQVRSIQGIASMTPVQVGDNSGSLTVDAPVGTPVFVRLSDGSSAIATLPVSLASLPALAAGTNNIGDVDVLSVVPGTGATNLGKAEDAGHTTGDVGVGVLAVRLDSPNAANGATADYLFPTTDMVGGIRTALYETDFAVLGTKHVKKYYTSTGAVTDGIVWSPAAGTRWYVTDIVIQTSAAATITLEDDLAGGDVVVWKGEIAANSGWDHTFATPLFSGEDAADLIITTSAGNVYVTITGYEI
jgi:hypothetical protein